MKLLKALFGPSRRDVWRQLAEDVDGQFHEGGLFSPFAVQARTGDWIITLDTYTSGDGKTNRTFTRIRAPYFNPEGFRFEVYRAGLLSGLGKAIGLQDIEVGHPRFDRDFVIKGDAPRRLRRLFDNRKIRAGIEAQPKIHLSVKGRGGWFSKFPDGVDELHFRAERAIKDLAQLRTLFDVFGEILRHICWDGHSDRRSRTTPPSTSGACARPGAGSATNTSSGKATTAPRRGSRTRAPGRPRGDPGPRGCAPGRGHGAGVPGDRSARRDSASRCDRISRPAARRRAEVRRPAIPRRGRRRVAATGRRRTGRDGTGGVRRRLRASQGVRWRIQGGDHRCTRPRARGILRQHAATRSPRSTPWKRCPGSARS